MRFIKLGLISIVFFSLLITGISLLFPSSITISRAIDINAPATVVHENVRDLMNWKKWYEGYDSAQATFGKITSGEGSSLKIGKTLITIQNVTGDKITTLWKTGQSNAWASEFNFISQGNSSVITVQWQFIQKVKWYPWEKFASMLSDKSIGPVLEKSLDNLKMVAENPKPVE